MVSSDTLNNDELRQQVELVTADPIKYITDMNRQIATLKLINTASESLTSDLFKQLAEAKVEIAGLKSVNINSEPMEAESNEQTDVPSPKRLKTEAVDMSEIDQFSEVLVKLRTYGNKLTEKDKQLIGVQKELTDKNKQIYLLHKQVNEFDSFFQVFTDKLRPVFNDFFATSGGLSEEDSVAINKFIANLTEQKQKIMNIGLESDHSTQEQNSIQSEPISAETNSNERETVDNAEDTENSNSQITQDRSFTNVISDEMLLNEVEEFYQSNDADELRQYIFKLKGFLCSEKVKRRLFEAISLHKDKTEIARILDYVTEFSADMISRSKQDSTPRVDLETLKNVLRKAYVELRSERASIKQLQLKISLDEKRDTLIVLSEQTMSAAKKLLECARNIRSEHPRLALELICMGIGISLSDRKTEKEFLHFWNAIIKCYRVLGLFGKIVLCCTGMIKQMPEIPACYFLRGCAYYELQDYGNALVDVDQALELDPHHKQSLNLKNDIESKLHK